MRKEQGWDPCKKLLNYQNIIFWIMMHFLNVNPITCMIIVGLDYCSESSD